MISQDATLRTICRLLSGVAPEKPAATDPPATDGSALIEQLHYHQITGLVYYFRRELAAVGLPLTEASEDYLKRYTLLNISRIMAHEHFLKQWNKRLQALGIEYRLFKGIVTAKAVYPEDYLRSFGDLDILIRAEDLPQIEELLNAEGFVAAEDLYRLFPDDIIKKYAFARHFNCPQPLNIAVDLHLALSSRLHPFQFNVEDFWNHRQSFRLDGQELQTFAPEYQAVYALYHAFKHYFFKLIWFIDAFMLMDQPGLNRDRFQRLIVDNRLHRLARHFAGISQTLFGRLPRALKDYAGRGAKEHRRINSRIILQGCLPISPSRARLLLPMYYLKGWSRRLAYLWRQLFPPMETVKYFYLAEQSGPTRVTYLKLRCRAISDLILDNTEEEAPN